MTDRELMQMALDAATEELPKVDERETVFCSIQGHHLRALCEFVRAALAQPEPEPVAHLWECLGRWSAMIAHDGEHADLAPPSWLCDAIKAATAPPQREWQGLTTQEIADETDIATSSNKDIFDLRKAFWCGARWAEAKLKEKNT